MAIYVELEEDNNENRNILLKTFILRLSVRGPKLNYHLHHHCACERGGMVYLDCAADQTGSEYRFLRYA